MKKIFNLVLRYKTQVLIIIFVFISAVIFINYSNYTSYQVQNVVSQPGKINLLSGSFDKSRLKSDADWKKILTPDQFHILREQGTEIPFTGVLDKETRKGTYYSVGCNEAVFRSEQKYDSGTGWPSFWAPISKDALALRKDDTIPGEERVEVLDRCGNHLGHVFDDGPQPTGKRYCINSIALRFVPDK